MLRTILILLVGVLVGANVVYFAMHRNDASADAVVFDATPTASPATRDVDPSATATDDGSGDTVQTPPKPTSTLPRTGSQTAASDSTSSRNNPDAIAIRTDQPLPANLPRSTRAPSAAASSVDRPSGLLVPVKGILPSRLSNTYDDARGTGRRHDALDIMAPRGTPVLAVTDGKVEKLFDSDRGGLTIYQFEPGGRYSYYYAHLDRYAPGLKEGQSIRKGEVIGYVGSTGNAAADAPHLHFAIFRLGPEKRWSEGDPINPYPVLTGKPAAIAQSR